MFKFIFNSIYSFINYNTVFKIKLFHPDAKVPSKTDDGCAGYDIFSFDQVKLTPGERTLVSTGISADISKEYYLRIAPRMDLSLKGIDIGDGVVDSTYRGEIKVLVINNTGSDYLVEFGSKIAQLILERCGHPEVKVVDILSETERGYGGLKIN